ncbi:MAG: helicase-associated domain-containing protein [Actinomycetes bacterium]
MTAEGFGAYLATLDDDALARLVARHHDLLHRPPSSLDELAARLSQPTAVWDRLQLLDRSAVQVAGVVSALGGRSTVDGVTAALERTGPVPPEHVTGALARLQESGLAWPVADGTAWRVAKGVSQHSAAVLGVGLPFRAVVERRHPAELETALRVLGLERAVSKQDAVERLCDVVEDQGRLAEVVRDAPPEVHDALERFATAGPQPLLDAVARTWLSERCLLWQLDDVVTVPGQLVLLARGDRLVGEVRVEPTTRSTTPSPTGGDDALRLVQRVRALLAAVDAAPPKPLQAGGIGVQEQRRLAKRLGADATDVRWLLDLCGDADLLTTSATAGTLTRAGAGVLELDEVDAYLLLVDAALSAGRDDGVPNSAALAMAPYRSGIPSLREAAACGVVGDGLEWMSWRWYGARRDRLARLLEQLERLALRHGDHPRPWAAPLADGDTATARAALLDALPPEQDDVVLQADGTAVVGGRPSLGLRRLLDGVAERESERTWRIDAGRVRRSLDAGASATALLDELHERSRHAVPQVVQQLVRDVAARHGRIEVLPSSTLLRVADGPLAVELLHDKRLAGLGLREVQPGLLSSQKRPAEVLDALRVAGHAPAGPAGREPKRPAGRGRPATSSWYRLADPAEVVASLRTQKQAGPDVVEPPVPELQPWEVMDVPGLPLDHLALHEQLLLLRALDDGGPVELDYRDAAGSVTTRVVEDLAEDDHLLLGWCRLREDERQFLPARILAVRPAR